MKPSVGSGPDGLPRLAIRVLRRLLGPGMMLEDVVGDLTEAYGERARRSRAAAAVFLWSQIIVLGVHRVRSGLKDRWRAERMESSGMGDTMSGVISDLRHSLRS